MVTEVFQDVTLKISEGCKKNCFPVTALLWQRQDNFNFGPSFLKGVFSKPSGKYIVGQNLCFLR